MDRYPITARSLEKYFHINGDQLERVYKDYLSGFRDWAEASHASSWLVFPDNIGPHLSIDETALTVGELYTIVSNKAGHGGSGSIVAIVNGTRVEDVVDALKNIPYEMRAGVHEITMDLSESMHAIAEAAFPEAMITADRFHVQQVVSDAMQEMRMQLKREARNRDVEAREQHKLKLERRSKSRKADKTDKRGRKPKRKNEAYVPERLSNGDTEMELLTRCRYLLMQSADKWTESQKIRARLLFERFPQMRQAYSVNHSLRMIFNARHKDMDEARNSLRKWYNKVTDFDSKLFNSASATIYEHEDEILNDFIYRSTNASAESLNAKIKNFRAQLHGVVDVEFFLYRVSLIYA